MNICRCVPLLWFSGGMYTLLCYLDQLCDGGFVNKVWQARQSTVTYVCMEERGLPTHSCVN